MITEWLVVIPALLYTLLLVCLAIYGGNFLYMAMMARYAGTVMVEQPLPERLPLVTVQLPIFNEPLVVSRVINAAASLDWPHDLLEIQVLDDSTDVTTEIIEELVQQWKSMGLDICHIHRDERKGFKAGALSVGLSLASGEFIAILDADFLPFPDFLCKTIGMFTNPKVGFVQTRWGHLNRDTSLLTYIQSLGIDGHFMVEQLVRFSKGYVMNFNGTAGVWRRAAIQDAGGWNSNSITEDLDLSYRAALRGWEPAYLPNVVVPCELVPSISAYRKQQTRWAHGSAECARRLIPIILRSHLRNSVKFQAILHLTVHFIQLFMLFVSLLYPFIIIAPITEGWRTLLSWGGAFLIPIAMAPTVLFLTAQWLLRPRNWWYEVPKVLALLTLGAGMMLNNSRAVLRGLLTQPVAFERTPKWGLISGQFSLVTFSYRPSDDWLVYAEFVLAGLNAITAILAWNFHNIGIFIWAALFATGLVIVATLTVWEVYNARM